MRTFKFFCWLATILVVAAIPTFLRAEAPVTWTISYTGGNSYTTAWGGPGSGITGTGSQSHSEVFTMYVEAPQSYLIGIRGGYSEFKISFAAPPSYDIMIDGVRRSSISFTGSTNGGPSDGFDRSIKVMLVRRGPRGPGGGQPLGEAGSIAWGDFSHVGTPEAEYKWPYLRFNLGTAYNGEALPELEIPLHPRSASAQDDIIAPNAADILYTPDGANGFTLQSPQLDVRLQLDTAVTGDFFLRFYTPGAVTPFLIYQFKFQSFSSSASQTTVLKNPGTTAYETKLIGGYWSGGGLGASWSIEDWHRQGQTVVRTIQGQRGYQAYTGVVPDPGNYWPPSRAWTIVSTYEGGTLVAKKRYDYKEYAIQYYDENDILKTGGTLLPEKITEGYDGPNYVTWLMPANADQFTTPYTENHFTVQPDGKTRLEIPVGLSGKKIYESWGDNSPSVPSNNMYGVTTNGCAETITSYSLDSRWADYQWPASIQTNVGGVLFADAVITYSMTTANGYDVSVASRLDRESAGGGGVTTVTKRYFPNVSDATLRDRIYAVEKQDGTKQSYAYEHGTYSGTTFTAGSGPDLRISILSGTTQGGTTATTYGTVTIDSIGLHTKRSTMSVEILQRGFVVRRETHVYNGTGFELVSWENFGYTTDGRQSSHTASNGASSTATWDGPWKTQDTDESGVTTTYTYDASDRLLTSTRLAVGGLPALRTEYIYNATGASPYTTRTKVGPAGDANALVSEQQFDTGGKLIKTVAPGGITTTYSYQNGGRTTTVVSASGTSEANTVVTENFIDGRKKSVTGSGTVSEYHSYGFENGRPTHTIRLADAASGRPRTEVMDLLGRVIEERTNGFGASGGTKPIVAIHSYNSRGLLWRTRTVERSSSGELALSANKLIEYDALGAVTATGLDLNNSGVLEPSSNDRYVGTAVTFDKDGGGNWWNVVTTTVYHTNGSSAAYQSTASTRLSGFSGGVLSESDTTDIFGRHTNEKLSYAGAGVHTKTVVLPDTTSAVTTTRAGVLEKEQSFDDTGASIRWTSYAYDNYGRVSTVTDSRTQASTTTYWPGTPRVYQVFDANSQLVATNTYDGAGRLASTTDANNQVTSRLYNGRNQVVQESGSGAYPVTRTYDEYGQQTVLATYRNGLGGTADNTTWAYDANTGWLVSKTDAKNKAATFGYSYTSTEKVTTRLVRGVLTTSHYDLATGDLKRVEYSDGTTPVSYTYTRTGKIDTVTDVAGTRDFLYDHEQLTTEALDPNWYWGLVVTNRYQAGTSTGANTLLGRYEGVRVGTLTNDASVMGVQYGYDNAGRVGTVDTTYPGLSRHHDYRYLANSNLWDKVSTTDGYSLERSFELKRNVVSWIVSAYGATTKTRFDYGVNTAGQRTWAKLSGTAFEDYGDATHWKYTYNSRGELETAKSFLGSDPQAETQPLPGRGLGFVYDTAGNRKSASVDTESVTYTDETGNLGGNALNQIKNRGTLRTRVSGTSNATVTVGGAATNRQGSYFDVTAPLGFGQSAQLTTTATLAGQSVTDTRTVTQPQATESCTYDDDGNLTDDGRWHYSYDAENRLTSMLSRIDLISGLPDTRVYFAYDYLGRRVSKRVTVNGTTQFDRKFVYDGWNLLAEFDTSNGQVARTYVWGLDITGSLTASGGVGALLLQTTHVSGTTTAYHVAQDANGNVSALVASGGAIVATYEYDPFGQTMRAEESVGVSNPFRFSSKYQDRETGFVYYGHRYYDPSIGRFINRDPIGDAGGVNLYAFVGNNGIDRWDYLGHEFPRVMPREPDDYETGDELWTRFADDDSDTERTAEKVQPESKDKQATSETSNPKSEAASQQTELTKLNTETPVNRETASTKANSGGYWSGVGDVFKGYGDAAVGFGKGLWQLGRHPVDSAIGIGTAIRHPILTGKGIYNGVVNDLQTNRGSGKVVGGVLIGVLTGGALKAASESSVVANFASRVRGLATENGVLASRNLTQIKALSGSLNISDEAIGVLQKLRRAGNRMVVGENFSLKTMAELQRAAQVEFGLFRVGDKSLLVRGLAGEVGIPRGATEVLAHTHPGTSLFSVKPSFIDTAALRTFGQSSSIIVTETGIAAEFTAERTLLNLWNVVK